jgi:hypothetical protein
VTSNRGSGRPDRGAIHYSLVLIPESAMGIQHARKELRTANKRRRKQKKNKLRSTKKYKK